MVHKTRKTLGFKKIMVYKILAGGGKPYLATGLLVDKHRKVKFQMNPKTFLQLTWVLEPPLRKATSEVLV